MATVVRRYTFVGVTNAMLTKFVGSSAVVANDFNGPVQDISIDDAGSGATAGLDEFMATLGFVYDPAALVPLTMPALFGDGSDGDVTLGAGTTTLTRDMYYNNLTVPNGAILKPAGRRIYVANRLTIAAGGSINADGGNGAAGGGLGAAGAVQATWTTGLGQGGAGQAAAGNAGEATTSVLVDFAGAGGAGGAGSGGAGGAGGTITALSTATYGGHRTLADAVLSGAIGSGTVQRLGCGAGGGGGGGNGATAGAGGGGGGGGIKVIAREIANSGEIASRGGAGGNASNANAGGGGGGGGGLIVAVTSAGAFTGSAPIVTAGAGGTGNGTGVAGTAGAAGLYIAIEA